MAPPIPPPSQAGKFKPRKQAAKKIVVGGAVAVGGGHDAGTTQRPPAVGRSSCGRGGGRGGPSSGRGGRGGRIPLPRGQVFFTGTPATTTTSTTSSRGTTSTSIAIGGKNKGTAIKSRHQIKIGTMKNETETEVIVGELDVGVGAHHQLDGSTTSILERDNDDDERNNKPFMSDNQQNDNHFSIAETYDSDSSLEDDLGRDNVLRPTQLPFPVPVMPLGIGASSEKRPALYQCQELHEAVIESGINDTVPASPFCDSFHAQALRQEQESWFLFQFPTRLPISSITPEGTVSSELPLGSSDPVVSNPALIESAFDNSLKNGGKLGTIKVYTSGKTVLDMGNGLVMTVSEGLPNGFYQQATVIDTAEGNYIVMGQVQKTVVVTPNIKEAFGI